MKNRLRGVALAGAALLAAACVVNPEYGQAADLAAKAPAPKVAAARYNWTGCYVGATVGYAAANDWKSTTPDGFFDTSGVNPFNFSLGNQATGGATLGCDWQANSWLVLGIEGEGGYLNVAGGASPTLANPGPNGGLSTLSDVAKVGTGYGLIAGRAGVAFDRLLIYGKVGVAFYNTSATITDSGFVATGSKSQSPFAVGLGGEYAIYDHWSGKAEYVFFDKGSSFNACGSGACFKQDPSSVQTFKLGLNYKFW